MSTYTDFLKGKGKPLSAINPGSEEMALAVSDALEALELLKDGQSVILGGDVLLEENNKLIYAYQLLGDEYHCLDWYCNPQDDESKEDYRQRSYMLAKEAIAGAGITAQSFKKKCYIVLVTE